MDTKNIYVTFNGTAVLEASISKDEIPVEVFKDKILLKRITAFIKDYDLGFSFKPENGTVLLQQTLDDKLLTVKDISDRIDLFNSKVHFFIDFVRDLKQEMEEHNLPISQEDAPDESDTEFIRDLLNDIDSANDVFGMDFRILVNKDGDLGVISGGITPSLIRRLFKAYLEKYGR